MIQFIECVVIPYVVMNRQKLGLSHRQKALAIFDLFAAHRCQSVLDLLKRSGICVIFIPGGCTGELQPLDVSVNDYFKKQLKNCFSEWYASKIQDCLSEGSDIADITVDLRTSVLKLIHARWLIKIHSDLAQHSSVITDGFVKSGIQEAVANSGRQVVRLLETEVEEQHDCDVAEDVDDLNVAEENESEQDTGNTGSMNEHEVHQDDLPAAERQNVFDFVRAMLK